MTDRTLTCCDCGREFVFSAAEQEFFRERRFSHEPRRCVECRKQRRRKTRSRAARGPRGEAGSPGDRARPPAPEGAGPAERTRPRHRAPPDRPLHPAVCSACGEATEVPFVPDGVRPVYCLPCLKSRTRG